MLVENSSVILTRIRTKISLSQILFSRVLICYLLSSTMWVRSGIASLQTTSFECIDIS
jgi:hypothetical protein